MISELKFPHSTNENEIKSGFDPALRDIKSRYVSLEDALIKIVKALKWNILKDGKVLYNLEILFYQWMMLKMPNMLMTYVIKHV